MGRKKYPKTKKIDRSLRTCAIYIRVSSEEQRDNFSLPAQLDACKAFAASKGWRVVKTYTDVCSAKDTNREAFQEMMDDVKMKKFDVIICHKLDRFSRSTLDTLIVVQELEEQGVSFVSVSEQYDFTTPTGKMLLTMLAGFAEHYLNNLRTEVMKGQRKRAEKGLWSSRMPFGYSPNEKRQAIPDENAEGVRLAFSLLRTGNYSLQSTAEAMNEAGYRPTGRAGRRSLERWSKDAVAYMVKNRFYLGEVFYRGDWYEGCHQAIITEEEFEGVQIALARRHKQNFTKAKNGSRIYLLSGMAVCAKCGARIRGTYRFYKPKDKQKTEYRYYRCSAKLKSQTCSMPYVSAVDVEQALEKYLSNIELPDDLTEMLTRFLSDQGNGYAAALEKELKELKILFVEEQITLEEYLERTKLVQHDLKVIRAAPLSAPVSKIAELLSNFRDLWRDSTQKEKQHLIQMLLSEVEVDVINTQGVRKIVLNITPQKPLRLLFNCINAYSVSNGGGGY